MLIIQQMTLIPHAVCGADGCWNNSDARHEMSLKLFLDCQDKTHLSVSNAWIPANCKEDVLCSQLQ